MRKKKSTWLFSIRNLCCFGFVIILLLSFGCKSKTVVKKLASKNSNRGLVEKPGLIIKDKTETDKLDGVMYRLPRTVIQVSIPVKKTVKLPGEYSDFAPCFFSPSEADERIKAEKTTFAVEVPTFSSRGEPDPEETYVVKTKGRYFEAKTVLMEYSPTGILTKGEAESKDESLDFTLKAVRAVAGLTSNALKSTSGSGNFAIDKVGSNPQWSNTQTEIPNPNCVAKGFDEHLEAKTDEFERNRKKLTMPGADIEEIQKAQRKINEEIVQIKSKLSKIDKKNNKLDETTDIGKTLVGDYKKAEDVYGKLVALQTKRDELVSTATNVTLETFKAMLEETDKAIGDYRSAFLGGTGEKLWTGNFEFPPTKGVTPDLRLVFKYSEDGGICTANDLSTLLTENKVVVNPKYKNTLPATHPCNQSVIIMLEQKKDDVDYIDRVNLASENSKEADKSRGWFYRIPSRVDITLVQVVNKDQKDTATILGNKELAVAQLGAVVSIPATAGGRTSTSSIVLDEATGALKNFKLSSTPLLDKSSLDEAEKTVQTIIDSNDPVKKKERELELLKLQNDINEQRKKLNESNNKTPES